MASDLPEPVQDALPATQRVYDALDDADDPLDVETIADRTRHAENTVEQSLVTLVRVDVVRRRGGWLPRRTNTYALADTNDDDNIPAGPI